MQEQEIIFLLGVHKSGTSLLRSLFEGYDNIYAVPLEAHFFEHAGYRVNYPLRKQSRSDKNLSVELLNWIKTVNETEDRYGDGNAKGFFDQEKLIKAFDKLDVKANAEGLLKYFDIIRSVDKNQEADSADKCYLEKSVDNLEFAPILSSWFPNAKFIHIVRNPYSNLVSMRKYWQLGSHQYPSIPQLLKTIKYNFEHLYLNKELIANYRVVRYEDLLSTPEKEMKGLSEWLNRDFSEELLNPSFGRKSWEGNSMTDQKFSGISNANLDRWKNEIYPHELYYVNRMFRRELEDLDYQLESLRSGYYKRAKKEKLKIFFYNRLFKFYSDL